MPLWFAKLLRNNDIKDLDIIPEQFEYNEKAYAYRDSGKCPVYVTILDKFIHHYTHEIMYYIRMEHLTEIMKVPVVEYKTITRDEIIKMLEARIYK